MYVVGKHKKVKFPKKIVIPTNVESPTNKKMPNVVLYPLQTKALFGFPCGKLNKK